MVAPATDPLKPPESQRTGLSAAPTGTEQAPTKPTQGDTEQTGPVKVPSTQSKAAPQGDVAASILLVTGAAASEFVANLSREFAHQDPGKAAGGADAAKGSLPALEAKSAAALEQLESANLAGGSARAADATSTSCAASSDTHGGYKSDFGSCTPEDARTSGSQLHHG